MYTGFCRVDPGDPSPKLHAHEVGEPVDVSTNEIESGVAPSEALVIKFGVGNWLGGGVGVGVGVGMELTTLTDCDTVLRPLLFVAVNRTV